MHKKKDETPTYFSFKTKIISRDILNVIELKVNEYNIKHSDILHYVTEDENHFRIGFYIYEHSIEETWFNAEIKREKGQTYINGEISTLTYPREYASFLDKILNMLFSILLYVPVLLFCAYIKIRDYIKKIPPESSEDEHLVDFMTNYIGCELVEMTKSESQVMSQ